MSHMIRLQEVLANDRIETGNCSVCLAGLLGDCYLCEFNAIFGHIRKLALAFGYSYLDEDNELWRSYQAFPLVSLARVLETRRIPYFRNVGVLERLSAEHPDLVIAPVVLMTALKRSYVLHESAHAVAHSVFAATPDETLDGMATEEKFVLQSVMSETFAQTAEGVALGLAQSPLHAFFYALNSYIPYHRSHVSVLQRVLDACGLEAVFAFGYILTYFSNWPGTAFSDEIRRTFEQRFEHVDKEDGTEKLLDLLDRHFRNHPSFRVNSGFRDGTTPLHFRLHGCEESYLRLASGTVREVTDSQFLSRWAGRFAQMAVRGTIPGERMGSS
jgi:hypothetical protein